MRRINLKLSGMIYRKIIVILFLVSILEVLAFAGSSVVNKPFGPREIAIGGSCTISDDVNAIYWNPASLTTLRWEEVSVLYDFGQGNDYFWTGAYVQPIEEWDGSLAGNFSYHSKTRDTFELVAGLSFARQVTELLSRRQGFLPGDGLSIGGSVKFIREEEEGSTSRIALDIGGLRKYREKDLDVGLTFQNIGKEWNDFKVLLGGSKGLLDNRLILSACSGIPYQGRVYAGMGAEYMLRKWLLIQSGYSTKEGISFGLGWKRGGFSLNYVLSSLEEDSSHQIGIIWSFGSRFDLSRMQERLERHFQQGRKYFYSNDLISAYRIFKDILFFDPTHSGALNYVARIEIKRKELEASRHIQAGRLHYLEGRLMEAREEFEKVLALIPEDQEAGNFLERIKTKFGEMSEADQMFLEGKNFYKNGEYEKAIKIWEKVLALEPLNAQAKKYLIMAEKELERKQTLAKKREAETHYQKGVSFYEQRKWEEAVKEFEKSLELDPEYTPASVYLEPARKQWVEGLYTQALEFSVNGDFVKAVEKLKKAGQVNPENEKVKILLQKSDEWAEEYYNQGKILYTQGNLKEAVERWENVLKMDKNHTKAKQALERARKQLGK